MTPLLPLAETAPTTLAGALIAAFYGGVPVAATFDRLRIRNAGPSTRAW